MYSTKGLDDNSNFKNTAEILPEICCYRFMEAASPRSQLNVPDASLARVLEMVKNSKNGKDCPSLLSFAEHGDTYFRQLETDLLKETSALGGFLVSCGGGAAMREENVREMKKSGIIVLLTALPETILERVADDENRPLLKGRKNTADIEALIEKRRPAYEAAANYRVATDQKTSAEIAGEILGILEKEGMIS